jgi:hypothetical protein
MEDWNSFYIEHSENAKKTAAVLTEAQLQRLELSWRTAVHNHCRMGRPLETVRCPFTVRPLRADLDKISTPTYHVVVQEDPAWYDTHTHESGGPNWTLKFARPGFAGIYDKYCDASKK